MLKQRKTVIPLTTVKFKFRYKLYFCCKKNVKIVKILNQHDVLSFTKSVSAVNWFPILNCFLKTV